MQGTGEADAATGTFCRFAAATMTARKSWR
jgi:hypothetical protein